MGVDDRDAVRQGFVGIEDGHIYFFYRPKVEHRTVSDEADVQRMFMVLSPDNKNLFRLSIVGKKKLPDPHQSGQQRYWGYISGIGDNADFIHNEIQSEHYSTKTRGERYTPQARAFGEGVYRILKHETHTLCLCTRTTRKTRCGSGRVQC